MKIKDIKVIQWNSGYDRNGSHDAGEYVEYTGTIGDVLNESQLYALGEAIQQAMETQHRETWDMAMDAALNEIERARCDGESDMRQVRNWIRVLTCPPLKKEKPE